MNQTRQQPSTATTCTTASGNRTEANDLRSEATAGQVAPDEATVGALAPTRLAALLGVHAALKTYMAGRGAPTLAFPHFAPLPRDLRSPSRRSRRADRPQTVDAQPTSAEPASDTAPARSADGPRRPKRFPPHGLRHSALMNGPDRRPTAVELKRLIRHFGTGYVEAILRQTKR
ncbi:UNVERIFIED_ORG: hypothetical protein M2193_004611 [Bradyrhizobium japonicum]|uniref:hypothetical protein n=1 Tax=Bradyrhizobium diazoefficiens TaxID=1355477 RepID=UPI003470FC23